MLFCSALCSASNKDAREECENVNSCLRKLYKVCSDEFNGLKTSLIIVKNNADYFADLHSGAVVSAIASQKGGLGSTPSGWTHTRVSMLSMGQHGLLPGIPSSSHRPQLMQLG